MTATSLSIEREAQARREAGETAFGPGVKWFLVATFATTVAAGTITHLMSDVWDAPGAWPPAMIQPGRVLPGWDEVTWVAEEEGWRSALLWANDRMLANIAEYESLLDDGSPMIDAVVPTVNRVITGWLRGSTESVYPGRDGWLFFRPDIDCVTGPGFLEPNSLAAADREADPVPAIAELRDVLAERDILLLVAPVPVKPTVYPDRFSSRFESPSGPAENSSYQKFLARLADAGIRHVDLTAALWEARSAGTEPLYLVSDTHWSPRGVRLAAQPFPRLSPSWSRLGPSRRPRIASRHSTLQVLATFNPCCASRGANRSEPPSCRSMPRTTEASSIPRPRCCCSATASPISTHTRRSAGAPERGWQSILPRI